MMGQMSRRISPTILHLATSLEPHFPGADLHPCRGTAHTLRVHSSRSKPVQQWEGHGWEVSGWQAGAAG